VKTYEFAEENEGKEYQFNKSLADLKYIFDCSTLFAACFAGRDYPKAADYLILWANAIQPLAVEKGLDKEYIERLESGIIKLDRFRDSRSNNAMKASINNFMIRYDRLLREIELKMGIYMTSKTDNNYEIDQYKT
jgi:hypothetical protein